VTTRAVALPVVTRKAALANRLLRVIRPLGFEVVETEPGDLLQDDGPSVGGIEFSPAL
jgi:hypothetical protein